MANRGRIAPKQDLAQREISAVVGFAARGQGKSPSDLAAELEAQFGGEWNVESSPTGFLEARLVPPASDEMSEAELLDRSQVTPRQAWEACRVLEARGFDVVEPIYLVATPSSESPGASEHFKFWGQPYGAADAAEMERISSSDGAWAAKELKLDKAWALFEGRVPGAGVVIAHPDTGYTDHPLINSKLQLKISRDFVDNDSTAQDPLTGGVIRNPGHGTSAGSVIVGPNDGSSSVHGVAPGAQLVPLRVSKSVILFDFGNVARAIEHAASNGCHVISMSLGGPKSSAWLLEAVKYAISKGVIVVSAAGNMLPTVVFPAAIPGVIAVAASNPIRGPWRFSGYGEEVTATAPGELVWNARVSLKSSKSPFAIGRGTGTSYAAAHAAGVAALWLSYHGRENIIQALGGREDLVPLAFEYVVRQTADSKPAFVKEGGFGAGVIDAEAILRFPLEKLASQGFHKNTANLLQRQPGNFFDLTIRELGMFLRIPVGRGMAGKKGVRKRPVDGDAVKDVLRELLGEKTLDGFELVVRELAAAILSKDVLRLRLMTAGSKTSTERTVAVRALRREVLRESLSEPLSKLLESAHGKAEALKVGEGPGAKSKGWGASLPDPQSRRLRVFTFDPSLSTQMETRLIQHSTVEVPWEPLDPGPVGDYLEIVDVDPASDCAYFPVDLDDPRLLAQDGHSPSMGNPQFHQQMVYAVAMKTIRSFETALGRPLFWSPVRPYDSKDKSNAEVRFWPSGSLNNRDQFVQRLRIYPHALRDQNAYYSPVKRALLFGYFNATEDRPGDVYPGGIVFTCLSQDIIAHETTHAIIDGMHTRFNEPTNPDVYAFHEAFSDIVALFQHFTYPDVLRDQIRKTRGDLNSQNLLVQLAQEFGRSTGGHHALRDAIGGMVAVTTEEVAKIGPAGMYKKKDSQQWVFKRYEPDATLLDDLDYAGEAHRRGSMLVAAVFDAFLSIYASRTSDLVRIATNGTGVLPEGHLQADLVNRLAEEARKSAEHVLRMCIRSLDYTPPFDITFGEFLRAVITADKDLVPADPRGYRTAFIESFRKWGIYPRDVRVLAEESLVWHQESNVMMFVPGVKVKSADKARNGGEVLLSDSFAKVKRELEKWKLGVEREDIFVQLLDLQSYLSTYLTGLLGRRVLKEEGLGGLRRLLQATFMPTQEEIDVDERLKVDPKLRLNIEKLRPARRVGPNGEFKTEMVFEVTAFRKLKADLKHPEMNLQGGLTLIVDMDTWMVRYSIHKRLHSLARYRRNSNYTRHFRAQFGAAEYRCGDYDSDRVFADRVSNIEAMRADSCLCRHKPKKEHKAMREPFALLHRGSRDIQLPDPSDDGGGSKADGKREDKNS